MSKRKAWIGRVYLGREDGRQRFYWLGRFSTKKARDAAVAKAVTERPWESKRSDALTCGEWVDRYLARYERTHKFSSYGTAQAALQPFRVAFGKRTLGSITPVEAEDWVQTMPRSVVPQVVTLFNYAKRMQVIDRNPFDGLGGGRGRGRADQDPPTVQQMQQLLDACDALGDYAPQMRALLLVGAHTGMRPGELFELRWADIDLAAGRITVSRRLYRGRVDVPKSGRPKRIALPPPARDILLRQPTRIGELVFVSKLGKRLTAPTVCQYWAVVKASAGLDFDFYLVTKHWGVHALYRLGLSRRAIAAQMGWSERAVDQLLTTYGHADLVALAEVDALYERDASVTQEAPDGA